MPRKREQTTREKRVQDVTTSKESPDALRPEHSAAAYKQCPIVDKWLDHGAIIKYNGSRWRCENGEWKEMKTS